MASRAAQRRAMLAEVFRQSGGDLEDLVELTALATALRWPVEEAAVVAGQLAAKRWIGFERHTEGGQLSMTIQGVEEAERMERPALHRWMADHPAIVSLMASIVGGLIVAFGGRTMDLLAKALRIVDPK